MSEDFCGFECLGPLDSLHFPCAIIILTCVCVLVIAGFIGFFYRPFTGRFAEISWENYRDRMVRSMRRAPPLFWEGQHVRSAIGVPVFSTFKPPCLAYEYHSDKSSF